MNTCLKCGETLCTCAQCGELGCICEEMAYYGKPEQYVHAECVEEYEGEEAVKDTGPDEYDRGCQKYHEMVDREIMGEA